SSLAATLAGSLERHGEGARFLEFALFRVDGAVIRIGVGAARPIRAPKLILGLFREKFAGLGDDLDVGFGFDMARLSVMATAPAHPVQADFTGNAAAEADLGGLIDRIGARLGPQSIATITARESYLPERSEMLGPYVPRDRRVPAEAPAGRSGRTLPLRLF